MRIVILAIILSLSNLCLAESFYAYTDNQNTIDNIDPKAVKVFSQKEVETLRSIGVTHNLYRVNTTVPLEILIKSYPSVKFENINHIKFENYRSFQWYLNNPGWDILRWITDIDTETIQANPNEDINYPTQELDYKQKIKVAIIDSGVDLNHPALKTSILTNEMECKLLAEYKSCIEATTDKNICHEKYSKQDANKNGYPLDCHGWNFSAKSFPGVEITGSPEINDENGHGTHVSGIIAAQSKNGLIQGVARNVEIIPIQVALNSSADSPIENMAKGLLYAIKNGAQVVNMSLGWKFQYDSKIMREMVAAAIKRNILIVVAAGNDSHSDVSFPCAYNDVICVGAHDESGELTNFSNKGTQVDIIAPGKSILSTWPTNKRSKRFTQDNNYEYLSGTSQAAPITAGVLANLLSLGNTPQEARVKLLKGARSKINDHHIRFGNLDYDQALTTSANSLIFPLNKSISFIKKDTRGYYFEIEFKNYGTKSTHAQIDINSRSEDVEILSNERPIQLEPNDVIKLKYRIKLGQNIKSTYLFNAKVKDNSGVYNYIIKTQKIRFIHPKIEAQDIEHLQLENELGEQYTIRPFVNIHNKDTYPDFVAHKQVSGTGHLKILKYDNGSYKQSKNYIIKEKYAVILNFYRVDIDNDTKSEYVILYVYNKKDGTKITKFLILDEQLKPKRTLLTTKNEFENTKTYMPGKPAWAKTKNGFRPTWIGFGENGSPLNHSPWESPTSSESNYLYQLNTQGLIHYDLDREEIPLHIIPQSADQISKGHFYFITAKKGGFIKRYFLYHYNGNITKIKEIKLDQYFDMMFARPLPYNSNYPSGYFTEASNNGSQIIFTLSIGENHQVKTELIRLPNVLKSENIKYIHLVTPRVVIFQTEHQVGLYNRATESVEFQESKVNTRRRRHKLLVSNNGIFLPPAEDPSYISEVLIEDNLSLISPARMRTLAIQGCETVGIINKNESDYIAYNCNKDKKILFLEL